MASLEHLSVEELKRLIALSQVPSHCSPSLWWIYRVGAVAALGLLTGPRTGVQTQSTHSLTRPSATSSLCDQLGGQRVHEAMQVLHGDENDEEQHLSYTTLPRTGDIHL